MAEKSTETRGRNWAIVAYPESMPEDWLEKLQEEHVPAFVSPLHDSDENPTGEKKKAHYHVLLMFSGNKARDQIVKISEEIFSGVQPERVKDLRAYARYLCHFDNPKKAQYSPNDVISLGGADYMEMIGSLADTDSAVREMMEWCREQGVFSFARLCDYAAKERGDWFRVLTSKRTVFMTAYLKSMKWEYEQELDSEIDRKQRTLEAMENKAEALNDELSKLTMKAMMPGSEEWSEQVDALFIV